MKCSMKADLDAALRGVRLPETRRAAILAAAEGKWPQGAEPERRRWRPLRTVLVVAAACAALTVTVFALSPTLRDALLTALGSFAPYSQTVDGVSATDQGIEVTVVSAMADRSVAEVYLEVRDLEQDRLSVPGGIELGFIAERPGAETSGWDIKHSMLGYDPDTRTALFKLRVELQAEIEATPENCPLEIKGRSIQPGVQTGFSIPLPEGLLARETRASMRLDSGERVLVPEQTGAGLEGGGFALSSIGFDEDGYLHIQVRMPEDFLSGYVATTVYSRQEDNKLTERYNTPHGDTFDISFEEDGKTYCDMRFGATVEDFSDICLYVLYGRYTTAPKIEGEWEITVPLENLPERVVAMDEPIGGLRVKEAYLTTLGVAVRCKWDEGAESSYAIDSFPAAVFLEDGKVAQIKRVQHSFKNDSEIYYRWTFDEAIDPEQVTGIAIGKWMIPIDGGSAGPGYWLPGLPE